MPRQHESKRRHSGPQKPSYYAIAHRDLSNWIQQQGPALGWSKRFIGLAKVWSTMVISGQHSEREVIAVEQTLKILSRQSPNRGGFGKLKEGFRDVCRKHEGRRDGVVLYGQHRHRGLFPEIFRPPQQHKRHQPQPTP